MLRVSKLTDYAVLVMSYLAARPDVMVSANGLAEELKLPMPTVSKILKCLLQHQLLLSQRGPTGGYRIGRAPEKITVLQIINALEGPLAVTECSSFNSACVIEKDCSLRHQWIGINQLIADSLNQIDLVRLNQGLPAKNNKKGVKAL